MAQQVSQPQAVGMTVPPFGTNALDSEVFYLADPNDMYGGNNNPPGYQVRRVSSNGDFNFDLFAPHDMLAVVDLTLVWAPDNDLTDEGIDLVTSYGGVGQAVDRDGASQAIQITGTQDMWFETDLKPVFPNLIAGDYGGVEVDHNQIGTTLNYLGIRLSYTRSP